MLPVDGAHAADITHKHPSSCSHALRASGIDTAHKFKPMASHRRAMTLITYTRRARARARPRAEMLERGHRRLTSN